MSKVGVSTTTRDGRASPSVKRSLLEHSGRHRTQICKTAREREGKRTTIYRKPTRTPALQAFNGADVVSSGFSLVVSVVAAVPVEGVGAVGEVGEAVEEEVEVASAREALIRRASS